MPRYDQRTCPYCSNPDCYADFVDIGVGMQQCAPFVCDKCTAVQISPTDDLTVLTEREHETGWWDPSNQK